MALEEDLRQILRDKPDSVVWVVGTGVPQGALRGTPSEPYTSWAGLLRSGLRRIRELGKISADELADHERLLGHDNLTTWLLVAETIAQTLGAPASGEFRRWLRETVGEFETNLADRTVLDALADHQRRGGLLATTNYDFLLETVTGLPAVTWRDPGDVERALRGDEPQVLHLHGAWRWTDSIVLGIRSYDDVVRDPHARAVMTTLRTDRTFVFVGCGAGLRDPNMGAFLKWTATAYAGSEYRHFRLCRKSELEALRREHPDEQRIFPLSYGEDHAALAPFLRSLLPPGAPANNTSPPIQHHATKGPGSLPSSSATDAALAKPNPHSGGANAIESLIQVLAEEYPDVRDARALWERAGGRTSEVDNISRPRDLWQRLWNRSLQGASVRPAALLRAVLQDLPNNPVLHCHLELLEAARE